MTQLFTDFSDSPTITERWNTGNFAATIQDSGIPSGGGTHALRILLSTSTARYAASWDNPGTSLSGDIDFVACVQHAHTSDIANTIGVTIRGGGSAGTEDGYNATITSFSTNQLILGEYNAGGGTITHGSSTAVGLDRNIWYRIRIQHVGTTLRTKVWQDGTAEPGSWAVSVTESTLTSGWVGIWAYLNAGTSWVAWMGVGTGGDPAPDAPIITGIPAHLMRTQHYGPRGLTGQGGPFNG